MGKGKPFTEKDLADRGLVFDPESGCYIKAKTVQQPREAKQTSKPDIGNSEKPSIIVEECHPSIDQIIFRWEGEHISLNDWYSSEHWTKRNKSAEYWHFFFKKQLICPYPYFPKYEITLEFNSRLDPSNCITMVKLCEDMLQKEKIIENDNKKFCKGIHIIPIETMKNFTYKLTVKKAQ